MTQCARHVPARETWVLIRLKTDHVRAVVGGFDQGASLGFGIQFSTANLIKWVDFRATLIGSPLLYRRAEAEAYIPKVFSENTHADFWFDYLRRPQDNFYGIGPNINNGSQTNYDLEQRSYNASIEHYFTPILVAGGFFRVANSGTFKGERDSDIPIGELFSGDPNVVPATKFAPGLFSNTKILSYGAFAEYDRRDRSVGLTKGVYFYGRIGSAHGLKNPEAFSDYGWLEGSLDLRGYIPLGSNKTSLALRGYSEFRDPRGNDQIPFYDIAYLGGREYLRGFRNYRFRGNNMVLFSAELRQVVWAQREDRGLDLVGFGDIGQVWGDNRSTTDPAILANKDFSSRNWKSSVGGGIEYRYSKAFAVRAEVGHTNERNLIYLSLTRGF